MSRAHPQVTTKDVTVLAVPPGVTTLILPVVAPAGTVTLILPNVSDAMMADAPVNLKVAPHENPTVPTHCTGCSTKSRTAGHRTARDCDVARHRGHTSRCCPAPTTKLYDVREPSTWPLWRAS